MVERVWESRLDAPVERVWEFHRSAEALNVLTPPNRTLRTVSDDLEVREGAVHILRFRQFGIWMEWRARIHDVRPPYEFKDTAERSPFAAWTHHHEFIPDGDGTILRDTVRYRAPGGPFAPLIDRLFVAPDLDRLFRFRHEATKKAVAEATASSS